MTLQRLSQNQPKLSLCEFSVLRHLQLQIFGFFGCLRWNANTFTQTVITYGWVQRKKMHKKKRKEREEKESIQ